MSRVETIQGTKCCEKLRKVYKGIQNDNEIRGVQLMLSGRWLFLHEV